MTYFKSVKRYFTTQKIKLPAILSDIDGVVYRGGSEIGNSKKVIKEILNNKVQGQYSIPFALLTNGGGIPESERAGVVNKIISLDKENCERKLQGEDMILCHSPFRDQKLLQQYKDKYVLVSGLGRMIDIAKLYGYQKAIDIEELYALYPTTSPVTETHDLLITKDGRIGQSQRCKNDPQYVKLYLTNPDLVYADKYEVPRHGQGPLIHCLQACFKELYDFDVEYVQYGKPERLTFDYAEQLFQQKAQMNGVKISNYYMIGDNPEGDIEGANRKGWNSILVKTGIFNGEGNDENHPAKYVVQDMEQAVKLIYVDGVILRGQKIIGNSNLMIKQILAPRPNGHNIPFTLLTNSGGFVEEKRAEEMNKKLRLNEEKHELRMTRSNIIQCHTPLSEKHLVEQFKDKFVLVCGYDEVLSAALSYGYTKAIHVDELAAVYPEAVPIDVPIMEEARLKSFRTDLETRFGKPIEELKKDLYFGAFFIMHGVVYSDLTIQIFADILGSKDGHILGERRKPGDPQVITVVATNPDLVWPYHWPVPRFGPLTFLIAFQAIFRAYYGLEVEYLQYGKPNEPTFEYCERQLKIQAEKHNVDISNFYMIGDNPDSDIDGANRKGWVSILVRTGIFQGEENSQKHRATYVVEDCEEAVKLIFKLENLEFILDQ